MLENAGPEKGGAKKRAGGNWRTTVAHIIKQNTRVHDAQKQQIIQLCWEKQRESIKSHDGHFTQTRGHPLPMADTVFAQGEKQKQTLTKNQSCQRKRDAVLHCTTLLHCRLCHCSCEMVLQNLVLHFPVLHFQRPRYRWDLSTVRGRERFLLVGRLLPPFLLPRLPFLFPSPSLIFPFPPLPIPVL